MKKREFDEVRRWGESLRRDSREEMRAAGQAIVLLCREVERLERELSVATAPVVETVFDEAELELEDTHPEVVDATLRDRLRTRLAALHR